MQETLINCIALNRKMIYEDYKNISYNASLSTRTLTNYVVNNTNLQ